MIEADEMSARLQHMRARQVRETVLAICEKLLVEIDNEDEKGWILLSQAEAKFGLNDPTDALAYLTQHDKHDFTTFQRQSFSGQINELKAILAAHKSRFENNKQ